MAREQRKLAAVLAADVVGYFRLMGRDEAGTLERLKAHRGERLVPALARNRGRLVKTTGDGALAEFLSAVDSSSSRPWRRLPRRRPSRRVSSSVSACISAT